MKNGSKTLRLIAGVLFVICSLALVLYFLYYFANSVSFWTTYSLGSELADIAEDVILNLLPVLSAAIASIIFAYSAFSDKRSFIGIAAVLLVISSFLNLSVCLINLEYLVSPIQNILLSVLMLACSVVFIVSNQSKTQNSSLRIVVAVLFAIWFVAGCIFQLGAIADLFSIYDSDPLICAILVAFCLAFDVLLPLGCALLALGISPASSDQNATSDSLGAAAQANVISASSNAQPAMSVDEFQQYTQLFKEGAIDQEEFNAIKDRFMNS